MSDDTPHRDPRDGNDADAPAEALEDQLTYQEAVQDDTTLPPADASDPGAGQDAPEFREPTS
jgi:hypothetical protein